MFPSPEDGSVFRGTDRALESDQLSPTFFLVAFHGPKIFSVMRLRHGLMPALMRQCVQTEAALAVTNQPFR